LEARELTRFEEAVLPHLDSAYTLARYLLRDPHDAEDAVQEAYLRALRHFGGFRGEGGAGTESARAWLLTIVRNTCHSWRRSHQRDGLGTQFDEELHSEASEAVGADQALERDESIADLRQAVERLPEPLKEVLVLRELQDLSYKEIAGTVGAPIGTVMSRLARARDRLQRLLRPRGEER
jgi:RNA polymerase sigma-70 factor (ECF subfamily)